jgi:hypothetical protein
MIRSRTYSILITSLACLLLVLGLAGCAAPPEDGNPAIVSTYASEPAASVPTEPVLLPTPTNQPVQPAILEARRLTLEWPPTIRAGDSDRIYLTLDVDTEGKLTPTVWEQGHQTSGETVYIPDLYETHDVIAEARLDMAGVEAVPQGSINEPMRPGMPVTFTWSVRPQKVGTYKGTIWLHLRYLPHDGGAETRMPLSVQLVEIQASNFLGMSGSAARLFGGVGVLLGSILGLDNLLSWSWKLVGKLRSGRKVA